MLVGVAARQTIFLENHIVPCLRNKTYCQFTGCLEPLRPLAPLVETDVGEHVAAVAPAALWRVFIKGVDKAVHRVHEVIVYHLEVENRDTAI